MHPEPRRAARRLWAVLLLLALAVGSQVPAVRAQSLDLGAEIFARVNAIRAEHGLPPYLWNEQLAIAARRHANDMAATGWISHTGPNGDGYRDRARDAGYPAFSWGLFVSENTFGGMGDLDAAMTWWMNSPVHRSQILSTRFREIGAASASRGGYTYYDITFGDRPDVPASAPPPPPSALSAPNAPPAAPVDTAVLPEGAIVYTVQPGDWLLAISRRFGISLQDLMALNHLSDADSLYPGQNLVISVRPPAQAAPAVQPAPLDRPIAQPVDLNNLPDGAVIYTVQPGDTLLAITSRYGVNPDDVAALNALPDLDTLAVGQRLVLSLTPLPEPQPVALPPVQSQAPTLIRAVPAGLPVYIVREGDTLSAIALRYEVSVNELIRLNQLQDPNTLALGQVLILSNIPESVSDLNSNTDRPPRPMHLVWLIAVPSAEQGRHDLLHMPQGG